MPLLHLVLIPLLAVVGPLVCRPLPSEPVTAEVLADTSSARLLLLREAESVQIVALYAAATGSTTPTRYELDVTREGAAGRSSSRQRGVVASRPGRTDTLSTMRVNVLAGDRLQVHLCLYVDQQLVDEVSRDTVVSTIY